MSEPRRLNDGITPCPIRVVSRANIKHADPNAPRVTHFAHCRYCAHPVLTNGARWRLPSGEHAYTADTTASAAAIAAVSAELERAHLSVMLTDSPLPGHRRIVCVRATRCEG